MPTSLLLRTGATPHARNPAHRAWAPPSRLTRLPARPTPSGGERRTRFVRTPRPCAPPGASGRLLCGTVPMSKHDCPPPRCRLPGGCSPLPPPSLAAAPLPPPGPTSTCAYATCCCSSQGPPAARCSPSDAGCTAPWPPPPQRETERPQPRRCAASAHAAPRHMTPRFRGFAPCSPCRLPGRLARRGSL